MILPLFIEAENLHTNTGTLSQACILFVKIVFRELWVNFELVYIDEFKPNLVFVIHLLTLESADRLFCLLIRNIIELRFESLFWSVLTEFSRIPHYFTLPFNSAPIIPDQLNKLILLI